MKTLFITLVLATASYAQLDVCNEIVAAPGGPIVNRLTVPAAANTPAKIGAFIKTAFANTAHPNLIIEVPAGTYSDEYGIKIGEDSTRNKGLCLRAMGNVVLRRTRFNGEYEPSVIKIDGVSNVVIKGFELTGYFAPPGDLQFNGETMAPSGISVVNFGTLGIENISILDNVVHTIGINYQFDNANGYWRYAKDGKGKCTGTKVLGGADTKFTCGQAHGIHAATNARRLRNIKINGNTLSDLRLGESEAITVGEWVDGFEISDNKISNVDNIGIDVAGMQSSAYQTTDGAVERNLIWDLRGADTLGGQNSAFPFIAGIYIDGGTGLNNTDKMIRVAGNTVTTFGAGIEIGSENNLCREDKSDKTAKEKQKYERRRQDCVNVFCRNNPDKCKPPKPGNNDRECLIDGKCYHVQVRFIEVDSNILKDNRLYGIAVGKDSPEQNSQTWDVTVTNNIVMGNSTATAYGQLHFGSLEADSLRRIVVRGNRVIANLSTAFLVRVDGKYFMPDVTFQDNIFYKDPLITDQAKPALWDWNGNKDLKKDQLFDPATNISRFSMDPGGSPTLQGKHNCWSPTLTQCP